MSAFDNLRDIGPRQIWDAVTARTVEGERLTLGVVELEANAHVPEHRHDNEQLGMVLKGSLRFRIGDEQTDLGPGGTWSIAPDMPHEVWVGPEGAVVIDVFAPARTDWDDRPTVGSADDPAEPVWPRGR
jgi:quercetin dioxygenase-like cupin family protein